MKFPDHPNKTWWIVVVEICPSGAQGTFESCPFLVRADNRAIAEVWACDDAHAEDLETRNIHSTWQCQNKLEVQS